MQSYKGKKRERTTNTNDIENIKKALISKDHSKVRWFKPKQKGKKLLRQVLFKLIYLLFYL